MSLRYLFVDMNAYFASVEQQDNPRLRGRPIAVVPVLARTTCCLAVSYEGKAKGVKTGTQVWEAEKLCPGMTFVVGRHDRYTELHHKIVKAVGRVVPVEKVMSVDEMACKLIGDERTPEKAVTLARQIKAEIRNTVGDYLRRRRLEVAAWRLLAQPRLAVLDVALGVGFGSPEAFVG